MMETYFTELCSRPCTAAFSSSCTHSQGIIETDLLSLLLRLHFFVLAAHSFRHFMVTRDTGRWLSLTLLSSNSSSLSDYLLRMLHLCSQLLGSYADLVAHPVFLPLMAPHSSPFLIHSQFLSVSSKWTCSTRDLWWPHQERCQAGNPQLTHTLLHTRETNRNQGTEHPPSKHKARCQHLDLSSQT